MPTDTAHDQDDRAALKRKIDALHDAETYPDHVGRIEAVQTHMAWVFLTEHLAYKMKKPVRYPFLDFSTLWRRQFNSAEEVRLNKRLAPDVYLCVVPLAINAHGRMELEGGGTPVEWLVKMRRLPHERMLDHAIERGDVRTSDIEALGEALSAFIQTAAPVDLSAADYRAQLVGDVLENERDLLKPAYGCDRGVVEAACVAQAAFVENHADVFDRRAAERRIIEGHGDLRPEHVFLLDKPVAIDCLEFNQKLRTLDALSDLAFLSLECERLDAPWIGDTLLKTYRHIANDLFPAALVNFYQCLHACTRARIALWHLDDPSVADMEDYRHKAAWYLQAAARRLNAMEEV